MKKVLLYSGGMDSWLIDKLWKPDVKLYVDMNTRYSKEEISRLPADVQIEKLDLSRWEREDEIIPLRNLYLVAVASNYGDTICIGATAGDRVLDKSYGFAQKASDLLSFLYQKQHWTEERKISVVLPFKNKSKKEMLNSYLESGGDFFLAWNNSFSCYSPKNHHPCFCCKPCYRKAVAFYENAKSHGINPSSFLSDDSCRSLIFYLEKNIIQDAMSGKTGRGEKEERDIIDFYNYLKEREKTW